MANATQETKGNDKPQAHPAGALGGAEDVVKHIPLSDIFVDYDWNARSRANVESETSEAKDAGAVIGAGLKGLIASVTTDGQRDPVVLRPVGPDFYRKGVKQPYALVEGFRRFTAIEGAGKDPAIVKEAGEAKRSVVPNTPNGTIRAFVIPMTEVEAQKRNLVENTDRENMTTPDIMFGVARLVKSGMSQAAAARELGMAQGYVNKLFRIFQGVPKNILEHWRLGGDFQGHKAGKRATTNDLEEISRIEPDRQAAYYVQVIEDKAGGGEGEDGADTQWLDAAKKRASELAVILAKLVKVDFVGEVGDVDWLEVLPILVGKKGKLAERFKAKHRRAVAEAARKAYAAEKERVDEPEGEGDDGEDDGEE